MKSRQFNIYLWLAATLVGIISTLVTKVASAEVKFENQTQKASLLKQGGENQKIRQPSELEIPLTSAEHLLVQSPTPQTTPAPTIQITGVKANPTDKGVEIILETPLGTRLQVTNRSMGNNFIADISGGQLRLPDGEAFTFRSQKPLAGITEIIVTNIDANTVRVTVVGEKTLPIVELYDDDAGLVFGVASTATAMQPPQTPQTQEKPALPAPQETPSTQGDEPIELIVTGEQDGYRVPNSSVGTRTDTPLRDIPQSIQVVPQQVLRDQNVSTLNEALRNVPSVSPLRGSTSEASQFSIRGFRLNGANNVL